MLHPAFVLPRVALVAFSSQCVLSDTNIQNKAAVSPSTHEVATPMAFVLPCPEELVVTAFTLYAKRPLKLRSSKPAGYQIPSFFVNWGHRMPQLITAPSSMLQLTMWGHSIPVQAGRAGLRQGKPLNLDFRTLR